MGRRVTARIVAALVAGALATVPAGAFAMPGDPPFGPLEPADGATLAVSAAGIPASFFCPQFRISDFGFPFTTFGFAADYGWFLSTSPDLGPDGRLAGPVAGTSGVGAPRAGDPATCDTSLGNATAPRPQATPGRYFWQVWRPCTPCDGGYEVGPVRSFTLRTDATLALKLPKRAYVGFPFLSVIEARGAPDGTPLSLQARKGGKWRTITTVDAALGGADAPARLTRGKHALRAFAQLGADAVVSATRTFEVVPARHWRTSRRDDGAYRDAKRPSVRFGVAKSGRELRGFKADVPTQCTDTGAVVPNISSITAPTIRIAPDGRFLFTGGGGSGGVSVQIRGWLANGAVKGGLARVVTSFCRGSIALEARLRR